MIKHKGHTGSIKRDGKVACFDKQKHGSSKYSYNSSFSEIFCELDFYPTRVSKCAFLFTWHDYAKSMDSLESIRLIITSTDPSKAAFKDNWQFGEDNPLSGIVVENNDDITEQVPEGGLFRTWVDPGYYAIVVFQYRSTENDYTALFYYTPEPAADNIKSTAPELTYDGSTRELVIGESMVGRRILEFYRYDKIYGYPTSIHSEETLNEMYYTSCIDMEWTNPYCGYYFLPGTKLNRWAQGRYTVGVQFNTDTNKDCISDAINNALDEINSVLNSYGIYFDRDKDEKSGDISIIVDSEESLFEIDPSEGGRVFGGTWETETTTGGVIRAATIRLANDYYYWVPYSPYETVALEELTQAMGAGFDQVEYPFDTLHTEFNYHNKSQNSDGDAYLTTIDKNILKLVYSDYVSAGDSYTQVARALNIPKGCYMPTTSTTDEELTVPISSFLNCGCIYQVRAFIVNSKGKVSETSDWVEVYVPDKPSLWSWTASNGSATDTQTQNAYAAVTNKTAVTNFSYLVWNDMVDKVKAVLDSTGESWSTNFATYAETRMSSSDKAITAKRFNSLRFNIGSHSSTGITDRAKGDYIYGWYFTTLASSLNSWINSI